MKDSLERCDDCRRICTCYEVCDCMTYVVNEGDAALLCHACYDTREAA